MGFFERLRNLFTGGAAEVPRPGFRERVRQRREERRRERDWKRSQKRQEKMEKEDRKREEAEQKRKDEQKKREAHEKGRETFKDRWGFNDEEYDGFIQFVSSVPDELKEVFGSENLVEVFRTGKSMGLSPDDMKQVLQQTYSESGGTQEDLINDLYVNLQGYAQNVKEGAYV